MNVNLLLSNSLLLCNLTYFATPILKTNSKNKFVMIYWFSFGIFLLSFRYYIRDAFIDTCMIALFCTLYLFRFFNGSVYRKLLVIILFILTMSFSELLIANSMNFLFSLKANDIDTYIYTLAFVLPNVLSFIILSAISKFIKLNIFDNHSKFMWFHLLLPMTTLLVLYNFTDYFSTFRDNIVTLLIVLGLIGSNIITLLTLAKEVKRAELTNEIKKNKMKYDLLNTLYNTNFYFLHDTIRTLTKLNNHMNKNNFKEFQKEVLELNRKLTRSFTTISSNSELLNSLLNQRITDISHYNITIKTVLEYNDYDVISMEIQQALFSELLTISIASCMHAHSNAPIIILKTKKIARQIIFQCSFSYNEFNILNFDMLLFLLKKHSGHISKNMKLEGGFVYYDILIVFFHDENL